jgi:signal transduction histidine kinase
MKWRIYLILFLSGNSLCGQVTISDMDSYVLNENVYLFKEVAPMSIDTAWAYFERRRFSRAQCIDNRVNEGFVTNVYWVAIPLSNRLPESQDIEAGIANGGIFGLEFFLVDSVGGVIKSHRTGDTLDFHLRAKHHRHFYFPFTINGKTSATIFYRIDMRGNGLQLPLRLIKGSSEESSEYGIGLFYSFFSGWLSFVFLFSLIIFLLTRELVYLWYSLYVFSYCLFFIADGDYDYIWLYPHWSSLATITPICYGLAINVFMLLFMCDFLFVKQSHSKLYITSVAWVSFLIFAIALIIIGYNFSGNVLFKMFIYYYCLLAFVGAWGLQILCIIVRIREKYKPAYLYALALMGVFLSAILYIAHAIGWIDYSISAFVFIPFGFATEIVIMSFALVYSYTLYKKKEQQLSITLAFQKLDFSRRLLEVQESEQKRIAEDLHDELGGNLAAIKMKLQGIDLKSESRDDIVRMIDNASANTRTIAHNLMPPEFVETNLVELLRDHINKLNRAEDVQFRFYSSDSLPAFNKHEELAIYRIVLEITNNIIRHADATESTIQLVSYPAELEIMAEDNGKGFDPEVSEGIGLKSIKSRVDYLQGSVRIDSNIFGTTVMIKIPFIK